MTDFAAAVAESTQSRGVGNEFTYSLDLAGTPGLVLPCGFSDEGLPYTMQLAGSHLSEAMLCRIGSSLPKMRIPEVLLGRIPVAVPRWAGDDRRS